jgi:hypothetical protein
VGLGAANTFADMKAQQIAPDIIDTYLVAVTGFNSGGGNAWPQWQYNYPDGGVVTKFSSDVAAMGAVPMFTLFQMPSLRAGDVTVINDAPFMTAYWAQAKLMYQKIAATGLPTLVNLEPDFWGFAEGGAPGGDTAKLPARVSMVPECASQPDTAVGVVGCLLKLGRTYAPKARMGFPPSMWYGNPDATGTFMAKLGADKADFIVAQTSDRDAGCFEVAAPVDECAGRGTGPFYLDENNVTTPNFNQSLDQWRTLRSHLGGLPILFWQTPMGVPSTTPGGTPKHYRDNHVHADASNAVHGQRRIRARLQSRGRHVGGHHERRRPVRAPVQSLSGEPRSVSPLSSKGRTGATIAEIARHRDMPTLAISARPSARPTACPRPNGADRARLRSRHS